MLNRALLPRALSAAPWGASSWKHRGPGPLLAAFELSLEWIKHPMQALRTGSKSIPKRAAKGLLSWLCCVSSRYKKGGGCFRCRIKGWSAVLRHTRQRAHGDTRFRSRNSAVQEHYLRAGILGVFLAYRKSLEIVKDRKMEGFFCFLKEKKVRFSLMHTLCRNSNSGNALFSTGVQMGRALLQWVTLANYLLSCLKSLDCSSNRNYKLSKSCNRYWLFAKVILGKWAIPGLVL